MFANVGTLMLLDPTYSGRELSSWVYLSWAFGLFAYQSAYGAEDHRKEVKLIRRHGRYRWEAGEADGDV